MVTTKVEGYAVFLSIRLDMVLNVISVQYVHLFYPNGDVMLAQSNCLSNCTIEYNVLYIFV